MFCPVVGSGGPATAPVARVLDALLAHAPALRTPLAEVAAHASLSRDRRALNARYLGELRQRAKAPVGVLPMLFTPSLGPEHIQLLAKQLPTL